MTSTISKLSEYFEKLPGIGPRQARRFVYYLLGQDENFLKKISDQITNLKKQVNQCQDCQRFFENNNQSKKCNLCNDINRNKNTLLITEKDIDLENVEKAGFYNGFYFVLGGLVPVAGTNLPKEVKMKKLFETVKKEIESKNLKEIILAFSANSEGDNTACYVEKIMEPFVKKYGIKISRLGRGLSTGTELEYSDKETIINAFKNRQ